MERSYSGDRFFKISAFYEKIQKDFRMRRVLFFAAISCLFSVSAFCAPYWGKEFEFHQPDGSPIAVRVWGDEFYIRAETLDGYPLVRDPVSGFICYAEVNNDGSDFISTGIPYTGQTVEKLKYSGLWPLAQGNGIKKGLRLKHQAVIKKADRNRYLLGRDQRGRILPAPDSDAFSAASAHADSPTPLIGQVVGLTLLIQFPDVPATILQADINNYCNQVGYTGYGNNGSVHDYFYDVSNGNLTYTNYVTAYYTAQHDRSYYTQESTSYERRARELIKEALLWLDDPSGQNFNFGTISTDSSNYMLAINAFYAGAIQNDWAEGLWPHSSSMYGMFTSNEGVKAGVYQITNIGSSPALGTFCHENGHMICDYPDLYDYGFESYGAGNYCLMAFGGSDYNPIPPNPYLRDIKGWESVMVFPRLWGVQYFLQSNSNTSYKYLNPDNSYEFFYIDSRTKTGRNSSLPDDGLVIWHIDEDGSNNNEQMTPSQHYLVSVEQADGLFHLEYGSNIGGSNDLFHAGYRDIFNDTTTPNAKWWNGNNSNLVIRQISAVGPTMSFVYDDGRDNVTVSKCIVTAGSKDNSDKISFSGTMGAKADDFNDANVIEITINSNDIVSPCALTFPIDANTFKKGKYNYSKTANGVRKSFTYNVKTRKFSFSASNVDLSGLGCPLTTEIVIGDYNKMSEIEETIVNGPRVPIPILLMMGAKDVLRVEECTVKHRKKPNSDKLTVKGCFAVEDTDVSMVSEEFVATLGAQTFTLPAGSFKAGKGKFTCSKAKITGGTADATFSFNLCSFVLTIKNTNIPAISGNVDVGVAFAGYDEVDQVTFP